MNISYNTRTCSVFCIPRFPSNHYEWSDPPRLQVFVSSFFPVFYSQLRNFQKWQLRAVYGWDKSETSPTVSLHVDTSFWGIYWYVRHIYVLVFVCEKVSSKPKFLVSGIWIITYDIVFVTNVRNAQKEQRTSAGHRYNLSTTSIPFEQIFSGHIELRQSKTPRLDGECLNDRDTEAIVRFNEI